MPRPRQFDETQVLDLAMDVFWRQGYDGASMADLTRAMGLNSPSIYAAFGSKRGLFDAVLRRYDERRTAYKDDFLAGTSAREVAERMLHGAVDWLTTPSEPCGCLLIQTGLASGPDGHDLQKTLARRRRRLEHLLTDRFESARASGDLGVGEDAAALARYIQTIFSGLAVQAAAGVGKAHLNEVVQRAMAGWPDPPPARKRRAAAR